MRLIQTVLCPVCSQGKRSASLRVAPHSRTPWTPCPGAGRQGFLPEEVPHRIVAIRYAIVADPEGKAVSAWRWVCYCRQVGRYALDEVTAERGGEQHLKAMRKRGE